MTPALGGNVFHLGGGTFSLSISEHQIREITNLLGGSEQRAQTVIRSAINETLTRGRTVLVRALAGVLNLAQAEIRSRIAVVQKATGDNLVGALRVDYERVPLQDFKAKFRRSAGVTVTTIKGEGPERFKHMFRATMLSGHTGIFNRNQYEPKHVPLKGKYAGRLLTRGPRKGKPITRQSISESVGPSVLGTLEQSPGVLDGALSAIGDIFEERLASKLGWQKALAAQEQQEAA